MSLRLAARLALRELRGGLAGFRIFLACLILGVAAIAGVGSIRMAILTGLVEQGATLLGGDAQAEFTYRFATDAEKAWMGAQAQRLSETADFRSMATAHDTHALTQVRAVDADYPLFGAVTLDPPMPLDAALAGRDGLPGTVMEPALATRLGVAAGDRVDIGGGSFVLMALLDSYPDNAAGGFGFGPRSIARMTDLQAAGLLSPGTLFSTQYRLDLPDGINLDTLGAEADRLWRDTGLRWQDARRGAPGTDRFVSRIGDFLILVGLAGLAVGGVGVGAAVRAYLGAKTGVIATLKTLGAGRRLVFQTYLIQIGALAALGVAGGVLLGVGAPILFAPLIVAQLPLPIAIGLYPAPMAEAALYGGLVALIFTLWPLSRAAEVRAAALYRDALGKARRLPRAGSLIAIALALGLLVGSAGWFTGSWRLTLWTAVAIAGSLIALALAAWLIRRLARRMRRRLRHGAALRLALAAIADPRGEALPVVLSLGLGLSVLASVGQIDGNLRAAFTNELPARAPSFFFVDIQPDQITAFRALVRDDPEVTRVQAAPMLRGIITRINGQPAEEVAGHHWVLEGDRGVTYSAKQPSDVTLTAGAWWPEDYDGPPQVSFSADEAAEMGLKLGDTITVNILGRDITATITSFRAVHFESAGMGFVMSMDPAAIAAAPHSWIATVYAAPQAEPRVLAAVSDRWPNVTAISIREGIDEVIKLVSGIAAGVRIGALATLVTGILVLIGAAAAGQPARNYEAAVLKTVGATRGRILTSFLLRAGLLGLAAGLVATASGIAGAYAVMRWVMETEFAVIWGNVAVIILGGIGATLGAGVGFALAALGAKPSGILRGRE